MASNKAWDQIFKTYCKDHDFDKKPFAISADNIKDATRKYRETKDREVRILAKIDRREDLPNAMKKRGLFLLPTSNGVYVLVKGEGFHDVEEIKGKAERYKSKLDFELKSAMIGDSEMQHLDYAYNTGLINHFLGYDAKLCLQIRGRKFTPEMHFNVGKYNFIIHGVQTEVDAGYEGEKLVLLIEAKSMRQNNFVIRQLFYPYLQWKIFTGKEIVPVYFSHNKKNNEYSFWKYGFKNDSDYNSIYLIEAKRYQIYS